MAVLRASFVMYFFIRLMRYSWKLTNLQIAIIWLFRVKSDSNATPRDHVRPIKRPFSWLLVDMRGLAQRGPAPTSHPVALGWMPALCRWSRQSGAIKSAVGGQNLWSRKWAGTDEGQGIKSRLKGDQPSEAHLATHLWATQWLRVNWPQWGGWPLGSRWCYVCRKPILFKVALPYQHISH